MRLKALLHAMTVTVAALAVLPAAAAPSLVIDVNSGKVLAHEDAFERWYPASLTKLMTAYVAFRAVQAGELAMNSPIRVTKTSAAEPPSKMGYTAGSILSLDNALKMILIKSANDIATAIGENVGGSVEAFAARMNAEAARLGMTDSHFVNAHGLPDERQYTTARDLALLVTALRTEFPQYADYFAIEGLRAGKSVMRTYNTLIGRFDGADGMKTGFICSSGFNLVGSATRDGRTLAAIVLGAESSEDRAIKAADMLTKGFQAPTQTAPSLAMLAPYGERSGPTDLREEICNPQAAQARRGERDEQGNVVINSPHIHAFEGEPELVAVGLGDAPGPQPKNMPPNYADVPIPTPRPDYTPPAAGAQDETATAPAQRAVQ
jgi:D-alanyl-D-alanine carboxypeptidase